MKLPWFPGRRQLGLFVPLEVPWFSPGGTLPFQLAGGAELFGGVPGGGVLGTGGGVAPAGGGVFGTGGGELAGGGGVLTAGGVGLTTAGCC